MIRTKAVRLGDTLRAGYVLLQLQWMFRVRGQRAVARATADSMRSPRASQAELSAHGIDAWQTARSVWRAKRWLPIRSTCLQTALATQTLFRAKGVSAALRVGVRDVGVEAHAWVEVGDFVLDDQRVSERFAAFDAPARAAKEMQP